MMEAFLAFLEQLRGVSLSFRLDSYRPQALTVTVFVPGHRYEVEFFGDGHIEVERFSSSGDIFGEEAIAELFSFGEPARGES